VSRVVSGWQIGGIHKFISGGPLYLTGGYSTFNNLGADGGIVFGNGLTSSALIDRLNTIVGDYDYSCRCFHTNVSDIQSSNGAPDPAYYKPATTPGVIGYAVPYRDKWAYQLDLSITKEIPVSERVKMGLKADMSNFLNHPFQTGYGNTSITGTSFGRLTSFGGTRNIRIRAYIDF
jgi:hypothetical protein